MAREALPEHLIKAGQELLASTDALGMQAQGAMWLYDHVLMDWRFYLVTSLVDTVGRRKTYGLLLDAFEGSVLPRDLTIDDVHLGSPHEALFRLISSAVGIENGAVRVENCVFNGVLFDGVIYRSVKVIPSAGEGARIEKRFSKRVRDAVKEQQRSIGRVDAF
jgi:hypothetical protein